MSEVERNIDLTGCCSKDKTPGYREYFVLKRAQMWPCVLFWFFFSLYIFVWVFFFSRMQKQLLTWTALIRKCLYLQLMISPYMDRFNFAKCQEKKDKRNIQTSTCFIHKICTKLEVP